MLPIERIRESFISPPQLLETKDLTKASVALCLRSHNNQLEVLFMRRAFDKQDHGLDKCVFPGGRYEPTDSSSRFTAERETLEEVGIDLQSVEFLGRCNDVSAPIISSQKTIHIAVYAYFVPKHIRTHLNYEVAASVWTSANTLANKDNYREFAHPNVSGQIMQGIAIPSINQLNKKQKNSQEDEPLDSEPVLWGVSLRILCQFFSKLELPLASTL